MRPVFRCTPLLAWVLVLLTTVECLQASYTLRVNLHRYTNLAHSKQDGFCCDQSSCLSSCNNQFSFCLRLPSEVEGTCSLGNYQSGFITDDNITFTEQTVVTNPVIFQVNSSWPGAIDVQIQVQDELGSGENEPVIFVRTVSVSISHDPAVTQVSTTDDQIVAQTGKFLGINFELECGEGFYGPDCGVLCTSRDDELGHFSCDSSGNSKCLDGFTDTTTNCTQCLLSQGCSLTGGYCNSTDGCMCREEFSGDLCDIDLNVCRTGKVTCENDGVCDFTQNNFSCICPDGYGGSTCEADLNVCRTEEVRCEHAGTCVYNRTLENNFICVCPNSFSGMLCETDLDVCGHTSPCLNSGTCVNNGPDNFTCSNCADGFEGRTCDMETDECVANLCLNGALCKDLHLRFECECSRGFDGRLCEIELDGCIEQTCYNNGTCQNNLGDFTCFCIDGFSGINCEDIGSHPANLSALIGPIVGGSVASAVLLIVIICLLVALLCLLRRRSRSKPCINSFKEAENTPSPPHILSVNNPSFKDPDTIDSKSSRGRFDYPITDESGCRSGHYAHLKPRTGDTSKNKPLAPTSSSVVDLINSIGNYSTLVDSTRTISTNASYNDHNYELIAETRLNARNISNTNHGNHGNPPVFGEDMYHDCSSVDESIPGTTLIKAPEGTTLIQAPEDQEEEQEIVLTATSDQGLPNPYEGSSATTSPDSARLATEERVSYDHLLVLKKETAAISLTESDRHDYDSADCGMYENTEKKDLEALYSNDLLPETEALYDRLN